MKEKTLALAIMILVVTSMAGVVYAHWADRIQVKVTACIGCFTIRFIYPLECSDNEATKDIGLFNCYYTEPDPIEGYEKLLIQISNAYPDYTVNCNFTIKNIGTAISTITNISITDPDKKLRWKWTTQYTEGFLWKDFNENNAYDPGEEIIYITITNLVNVSLNPGQTKKAEITTKIIENAEECHTYSFEVSIEYES